VNSRVIQGITTCGNLVPQAGQGAPKQAHGAGDVRSGHGRAAGKGITTVAGVTGRARVRARSTDVRLDPVAAVPGDRAPAAKRSDRVKARIQSSGRIRSLIKRRWIRHSGTTRTGVTRSYYHLDTSGLLRFYRHSQFVTRCAAFRDRAAPGVNRNVRCLRRVALRWSAVKRVRRQEKFHAFDVSGRCAVAHVHVTATDPLRAGRHPDLVAHPIVAYRGAGGMTAMEEVIAREWRIIAARITDAVVDGIVPVVIVIGVCSVPAAIMRLQCVMRPALASIRAGNHNVLPGEPERPDLGCVRVSDPRLDRRRSRSRRFLYRAWLRQVIVDNWIA
jgi:hypothetical protein